MEMMRSYPTQAPQSLTSPAHLFSKAYLQIPQLARHISALGSGHWVFSLSGTLTLNHLSAIFLDSKFAQKSGLIGLITLFKTALTVVPAQFPFFITRITNTVHIFLTESVSTHPSRPECGLKTAHELKHGVCQASQ